MRWGAVETVSAAWPRTVKREFWVGDSTLIKRKHMGKENYKIPMVYYLITF